MASEPIDVSSRPSMRSVQCGGGCNEWIVVDAAFTGVGMCSTCLTRRIGMTVGAVTDPPPQWSSEHNPPPASAVYPPSPHRTQTAIRVADPNLTGLCSQDRDRIVLYSLEPADVGLAYAAHNLLRHDDRWLVGGPGGAVGDVCDPCGGGTRDRRPLEGGPRHDLCLRGRVRGRGRDCPCTHNKPHMRGVKPDHLATRPTPRPAAEAEPVVSDPVYLTGYLFDPEEPTDD